MRLQLRSAFILLQTCCLLVLLVTATKNEQQLSNVPLIQGIPIISSQARAMRIAEFVSSRKVPNDFHHKTEQLLDRADYKNDEGKEDEINFDMDIYGNIGLFYKDKVPLRKSLIQRTNNYLRDKQNLQDNNKIFSGIRINSEKSTTLLPILTTQRDTQLFDFVPVNIIRNDAKGNPFASFDNKNFEDLSDISLIPAGSNTRIQVKKGPNGKDYEYEYVYYYYDEEEEGKGGTATSNSQEAPTRMSAPISNSEISLRRSNSNRNKYNTLDRSTTIEPVINEVIPSGIENITRQLDNSHDDMSEERLPTNTRFPPRSQVNQAVETTERTNRLRNNRQRATLDSVDSNSFRSQQEGPEFPQNLPNGPVRFLGVTPNEGNEEKLISRSRIRPHRIQEPAPVHENFEEPTYTRKRPIVGQYDVLSEKDKVLSQLQTQYRQYPYTSRNDEFSGQVTINPINSSSANLQEYKDSYADVIMEITDSPNTQMPQAMDKVALDLYAFLQQGRSNLIDFVKDSEDDNSTTEPPSGFREGTSFPDIEFEDSTSTLDTSTITPTTTSTSATIIISTTTTSTTTTNVPLSIEESSSVISALGRGKFRRPGVGSSTISRNRFKSSASSINSNSTDIKTTDVSLVNSSTHKTRGRFGQGLGSGGFKRTRPYGQKQPQYSIMNTDEQLQKDDVGKLNIEMKTTASRGRFRGGTARLGSQIKTTLATTIRDKLTITTGSPLIISAGSHRPNGFNKLNSITKRRGNRPTGEQIIPYNEQTTTLVISTQENNIGEQQRSILKLPTAGVRSKPFIKSINKPGIGRLNLRSRQGQQTSNSTATGFVGDMAFLVPSVESTVDEPASEGTEEETREALVESSLAVRPNVVNPLNKLRNRNRIQVQPKTTTARTPLPPASRRSPLLPRRKTTEATLEVIEPTTETQSDTISASDEFELTESTQLVLEVNVSMNPKHEESAKSLSSLLAPRRRLAPRRLGQQISSITE